MKRFDVNCFSGHWPFHSTAHPGCEHLAAAHKAAGIEGGLITSLQTVFYLAPLTAARQLYQQLPEGYGQVFAINPLLPDADQLCIEAFENYAVKGIRLVPTFHNFAWEDKGTQAVLSAVEKLALPLFITLNLEDPRVDYMVLQASLDMAQLSGVLKDLPDVPVIVTHGYWGNLSGLSSAISSRKNTFADISGLNALVKINNLDFSYNQVKELPKFQKNTPLASINGSYNQIEKLTALSSLPNLNVVLMDYNEKLASLEPLDSCPRLIKVNAYGTKVSDVRFLTDKSIVVNYNPANDKK